MAESAASEMLSEDELAELKVRCLTLHLNGMALLIPNTVVAEVLDYREPEETGNMPGWFLGMIPWRGRNVPLVAFEKLMGQEQGMRSEETRLVVCNTLNGNARIPFIALKVDRIPHLTLVDNRMLAFDDRVEQKEPAALAYMRFQGESTIVPNIDVIEKMLEHLGVVTG